MPLVTAPANTLREGHSSFQHSTEDIHPVDAMQQQVSATTWSSLARRAGMPLDGGVVHRSLPAHGATRCPQQQGFTDPMRPCA